MEKTWPRSQPRARAAGRTLVPLTAHRSEASCSKPLFSDSGVRDASWRLHLRGMQALGELIGDRRVSIPDHGGSQENRAGSRDRPQLTAPSFSSPSASILTALPSSHGCHRSLQARGPCDAPVEMHSSFCGCARKLHHVAEHCSLQV